MTIQQAVRRGFPQYLAVVSAILVWWTIARFELVGRTLIASPMEVLGVLSGASGEDSVVWSHALHTLNRALQGWFIALLAGSFIALCIGRVRALYLGAEPLVEFVRSVPPVLIFPLLLVAFSHGIESYVWTIALGCAPVMVLVVARRLQELSEDKMELLKLYRVGPTIRWVVMGMEIMPGLFLGSRFMLSIAIVISVVTEMIVAPNSPWALGALAQDALMSFNTPQYFAAVLIIGGFGYLSNAGLRLAEGRLARMVGTEQRSASEAM